MHVPRTFKQAAAITALTLLGTLAAQQALAVGHRPETRTSQNANLGGKRIAVVGQDAPFSTASTSYVTLDSAAITVPANQTALITATYSAEALCKGSVGWCSIRLVMDGVEMYPQAGSNFAFAAVGDDYAGNTMERFLVARQGSHTVTVQLAVVSGATEFDVDDWVLDLETWRQT